MSAAWIEKTNKQNTWNYVGSLKNANVIESKNGFNDAAFGIWKIDMIRICYPINTVPSNHLQSCYLIHLNDKSVWVDGCILSEKHIIECIFSMRFIPFERNENESEKQHYNGIWLDNGKFVYFALLFYSNSLCRSSEIVVWLRIDSVQHQMTLDCNCSHEKRVIQWVYWNCVRAIQQMK